MPPYKQIISNAINLEGLVVFGKTAEENKVFTKYLNIKKWVAKKRLIIQLAYKNYIWKPSKVIET